MSEIRRKKGGGGNTLQPTKTQQHALKQLAGAGKRAKARHDYSTALLQKQLYDLTKKDDQNSKWTISN